MNFPEGKVALVTGGASGIGLAIVKKLLDNNIKGVGIVDFSEENWNNAKSSLKRYENKIIFIKADVSIKEELKNAFEKTVERFKNLDIVVNNAGILDEDNWEKMLSVNVTGILQGIFLAINEYLPKYKSGKEGLILNTASVLGIDTISEIPVYCASKHAIIGFVKSMSTRKEFQNSNIRLLTICPGLIQTNIFHQTDKEAQNRIDNELMRISDKISPAEYVADSVLALMSQAKHGTVWVVEDEKTPYEVIFPSKQNLKQKILK